MNNKNQLDMTSIRLSKVRSPRLDSNSTGRPDSNLSSSTSLIPSDVLHDSASMKRLLEDKISVIKMRNVALINENKFLRDQLNEKSSMIQDLKGQLLIFEKKISVKGPTQSQQDSSGIPETNISLCKLCQKTPRNSNADEPLIFITKAELDKLERDVQILRDSLKARDNTWNAMMESEENYCRQLTHSAQEVVTANQLAENHYNDLKATTKLLEEREHQLRMIEKDSMTLKSLIEEKLCKEVGKAGLSTEMKERFRKSVEKIIRQVSTPRHKITPKRQHVSSSSP